MAFEIDSKDVENLRKAIARSPQRVLEESRKFLTRGIAAYLRTINTSPWRVGQAGGGSPVRTGQLKGSHLPPIYSDFEAIIRADNTGQADYAPYIHEGTYKMQPRPWLDYAKKANDGEIIKLSEELLKNIVTDLAK
jgi:hypothetical protein